MTPPNPNAPSGPSPSAPGQDSPGQNKNRIILSVVVMVVVLAVLIVPEPRPEGQHLPAHVPHVPDQGGGQAGSTATVDQSSGVITGTLTDGTKYSANGPNPVTDSELHAAHAARRPTTSW